MTVHFWRAIRSALLSAAALALALLWASPASAQTYGEWIELGPPPQTYSVPEIEGVTGMQLAYCPAGALDPAECALMTFAVGAEYTCSAAAFGISPDFETPVCHYRYSLGGGTTTPPVIGSVTLLCTPPWCMSGEEGALVGSAIASVWLAGWAFAMFIRTLRNREED